MLSTSTGFYGRKEMKHGFEGKCVDCGKTFAIDELRHVWMDYEPDDLEEGDEPDVYCGLHCKACLKTAGKLTDSPIIDLDDVDSIIEGFGLTVTDEEDIG